MNVLDLDDWDPLSRKSITTNREPHLNHQIHPKTFWTFSAHPLHHPLPPQHHQHKHPSSSPPNPPHCSTTPKPSSTTITSEFPPDTTLIEPSQPDQRSEPLVTLATSESPTLFDLEELDPLKLGGRAAVAAEKVDLVAGGKTKKGHFGVFDRLASGVAGGVNAVVVDPEREALLSKILDLQESLREQVLRTETARIEHRHLSEEDGILRKYIQNLMVNTRRFE
ncbi:hypothetical protein BC829DRAFT_433481 [Chytridium lagenaria]|nr:hypothetical protein BC829DRAFT_433481 [Chytridium lagenaria]